MNQEQNTVLPDLNSSDQDLHDLLSTSQMFMARDKSVQQEKPAFPTVIVQYTSSENQFDALNLASQHHHHSKNAEEERER